MLKGMKFLLKKSKAFKNSPRSLSSLRVKRSNPLTSPHTLSSLLRCAYNDDRQGDVGRSMIEMLGVLAIIAVLSVAGIAGYSKAMQKFKVNKIIYEYNNIILGMMEQADNFRYFPHQHLGTVLKSLNIIPQGWKMPDSQTVRDDIVGNEIMVYNNHGSETDMLTMELRLGGAVYKKNNETNYMCREVLTNLVYPLHDTLYNFFVWQADTVSKMWFGDKYVSEGRKAIKDMMPSDIQAACSLCVDKGYGICAIVISF